ncbi:MAG: hypothetical protein AAF411_28445, partial [Myxococcota bacterium]
MRAATAVLLLVLVSPRLGAAQDWGLTRMRGSMSSMGMRGSQGMRGMRGMRGSRGMRVAMTSMGSSGSSRDVARDRSSVLIARYRGILERDPQENFAYNRLLDLYRERDG